MQACPYGAIMERSKIIDIHKSISNPKKKIVAIPAPAIYGQFNATPGQVLAAIKQIGFDDVIEVALGAEITAANEAKELEEKMQEGQAFMTTSCCPAYTGWVDKHAPMLKPYVSETRSPMVYAARYAKEKYPDAEVVFIGPCLAKRHEADSVDEVDYVMSFEELGAFMVAYDIDVANCSEKELNHEVTKYGRGFAQAGGVQAAVVNAIGDKYSNIHIEGLDKKNQALLKSNGLRRRLYQRPLFISSPHLSQTTNQKSTGITKRAIGLSNRCPLYRLFTAAGGIDLIISTFSVTTVNF